MTASVYIAIAVAMIACAIVVGWLVLKNYPPLRKNTEEGLGPDDDDE